MIDQSVYPDCTPPRELRTEEQRADYLHRICGAFDYGIPPEEATLRMFLGWRDIFDRHPVLASPGYHALRDYCGLESLEMPFSFPNPPYLAMDAEEGRSDPCEHII